jgi:putative hydrolases of HD superfamily
MVFFNEYMLRCLYRYRSKQSYVPFHITIANLEKTKYPHFAFSKTFTALYQRLKADLLEEKLISND